MTRVWVIALLSASLVAAPSGASAPGSRLEQVVPTVMEESATIPVDLDADGADDFVVLSRDGVAQRYASDGTLMWSTSSIEVADELGVVAHRENDAFWADFEGISSCGSMRSTAFHDVDGDGTSDVMALLWLRSVEPEQRVRTVVVQLDGATGDVLDARPLAGRALAQAVGDLDGDGRAEHVVVEEDGPPVTWGSGSQDPMDEGTGADASVRVVDLVTGEARWSFDTGVSWPVISGLAVAPRPGGGDVVVSFGGSNSGPRCTGSDVGAQAHRVVALAGEDGGLRWDTMVDGIAQDLIPLEDGGLATWTDDAGGTIEVLETADGARRWRRTGLDGGGVLGAVAPAGDALAALVARPATADQNESRLLLLDPGTGATVQDVLLDDSGGQAEEMPEADELKLVETGLGGGLPVVAARTSRTLSAVTAQGLVAWQESSEGTAQHTLVVGDGGARLWTQGTMLASSTSIDGVPVSLSSKVDTGFYRLTGRSTGTGEPDATLPLLANVLGATRTDITSDGVPDRVFGGLGQVLMATDGVDGDVRWQTDLQTEILDVWPEDLDGDGSPDLLVEAQREVIGVRGHDGELLWRYTLSFPALDGFASGVGGAWRDAEPVDVTNDGVRDLVLGFRTARDEAWAPAGNAKVIVVNGATGAEHWRAELPHFVKGVNAVATGDATGDGVPDVAASLDAIGDAIYYGVILLDGADGSVVWAEHEFTGGSRDTWGRDSVELVDHGSDGDLDVAVLTRWFDFPRTELDSPAEVRMHDGATGAFLQAAPVAIPGIEFAGLSAMQTADFGPAGRLIVVYARHFPEGGSQVLVHGFRPHDLSTRFAIGIPAEGSAWDVATGDVTGDGVADLVVPISTGLYVADGAAALEGELEVLAQPKPHRPLKAVLVDADGDGISEIETLETPAGWPLQIGPVFRVHTVGVVRTLGLVDLSP